RLYWENKASFFDAKPITIPFAITVFPDELYQAPRSWAERAYPHNLLYYNQADRGAHFAAWEQPDIFSAETRAAFRSLRKQPGPGNLHWRAGPRPRCLHGGRSGQGGQPRAPAAAASVGWERPPGHLEDERLRGLPDAPVLKRPGVGHGSVAGTIKQARRREL